MFGTGSGFWLPTRSKLDLGCRVGDQAGCPNPTICFEHGSKPNEMCRADLFGLGSFVGICIELAQFGMIFGDWIQYGTDVLD